MTVDQIEDRLAIRELVETFAVGIMRKDFALWGSTWAEEASWNIPLKDEPIVGRDNIVAFVEGILEHNVFVSLICFPSELVVDGDTARGKSYNQEMIFPKAGGQRILVGCFHDTYVKRDGRWYFQSRVYEALLRSSMPPE